MIQVHEGSSSTLFQSILVWPVWATSVRVMSSVKKLPPSGELATLYHYIYDSFVVSNFALKHLQPHKSTYLQENVEMYSSTSNKRESSCWSHQG